MAKRRRQESQDRRKVPGTGLGMGTRAKPTHTPLIALRLPPALIAQADALVPKITNTGEMVGVSRSLVLRMALVEGLRVLNHRYES
jgi:hypothetical protein